MGLRVGSRIGSGTYVSWSLDLWMMALIVILSPVLVAGLVVYLVVRIAVAFFAAIVRNIRERHHPPTAEPEDPPVWREY